MRIPTRSCLILILGLASLAVSGCGDAADAGVGVSVTDSAGIRVVRFDDLAGLQVPEQTTETVAEIGREEGGELYRVSQARFLADGRLAVGNSGTSEILYFGPGGALTLRTGGAGEGPGEFGTITSLPAVRGDTLTVYDVWMGRLTVLDGAGEVVSTRPLEPPNRVVDLLPLALGEDGRVLAVFGDARIFLMNGQRQDTVPLMVLDSAGGVDTLSLWPGKQWSFSSSGRGASRTEIGFGRSLATSGRDGRAVVGSTGRLTLVVVTADGTERLRIEGSSPNRPVTEEEVAAWRSARLEDLPAGIPEATRTALRETPYNETHPAFSGVLLDAEGRIWVGHVTGADATERSWTVFTADGTPAFRVTVPADARPLDAREDRVAVLERTELAEEVIRVLELGGAR